MGDITRLDLPGITRSEPSERPTKLRRRSPFREDPSQDSFEMQEKSSVVFSEPVSPESHIKPMNVEWVEPSGTRHSNVKKSFGQAAGEAKVGTDAIANSASALAAHTLRHVPGVGIAASGVAIKTITNQIEQTQRQIDACNHWASSTRSSESEPQKAFSEALEFSKVQSQKRLSKLEERATAAGIGFIGASLTAASPISLGATLIPGIAVSAAGSAISGAVTVSSAITFFEKLFNGTLGKERYQHANTLYGLALEHLELDKGEPPPGNHSDSADALNRVRQLGTETERREVRRNCFDILQDIGVIGRSKAETEEFQLNGLQAIAYHLRSSW